MIELITFKARIIHPRFFKWIYVYNWKGDFAFGFLIFAFNIMYPTKERG